MIQKRVAALVLFETPAPTMSVSQRAPRREPLQTASSNESASSAKALGMHDVAAEAAKRARAVRSSVPAPARSTAQNKLAANPFMQQQMQHAQRGAGRENVPTRPENGFAAARRKFTVPTSQESSVMSRSKTARKVSEANLLGAGRLRLSRQSLASFPSLDAGALTEAVPSVPVAAPGRWMDRERDNVQAYEYLCHCSEAQQWIERCIGEPLGGDIANMAEEMRNGIALAKLAKSFEPACVPRIFVHPRLQFRHTDNINYYFQFVDKIRLPNCFRFELTDLYEKKNFPKVVYCLHALSHFMAHHGRSDKVDDLVGKLEFNEEQLHRTQKTIDAQGGAMPSFGGVGQALAQEMGAGRAASRGARADTADAPRADAPPSLRPTPAPPKPLAPADFRAALRPVGDRAAKPPLARELTPADTVQLRPVSSPRKGASPRKPSGGAHAAATGSPRKPSTQLTSLASQPMPRSPNKLAHDALERARRREEERAQQREERERRRRELEHERERQRAAQERERERERERLRAEDTRDWDRDRSRRDQLYLSVRSFTQREFESAREHESMLLRERERFAEERAQARRDADERARLAAERARAEEREREEKERFQRELEYELERKQQMEAYAAELAAAHAETAAAEARLHALTAEAARRDAADRARALARLAPLAAAVRGYMARRACRARRGAVHAHAATVVGVQAAARGALARRAQDAARAHVAALASGRAVVGIQAHVRGYLVRGALFATLGRIDELWAVRVQTAARGALARRRVFATVLGVEAHADAVVCVQAHVRGLLTRRALLRCVAGALAPAPALQAHVRGALARRAYARLRTALLPAVERVAPGGAPLRAALSRRRHAEELHKQRGYVKPDVTGVQAQVRGALVRADYAWWRAHLHDSAPVATYVQALLRGELARRAFAYGMGRFLAHRDVVIRLQSRWRARAQGAHYRALRDGTHVPLATLRAFAHLLDDSGRDYREEIEVEQMRTAAVQRIRENQQAEAHVADLDRKIALLVKNKIGIEEVVKAKTERGLLGTGSGARHRVLAAADDPFADCPLGSAGAARLELYQALFYLLQTRPAYLARLLVLTNAAAVPEHERRQLEQTVLAMFAYAQHVREEFLLLKLVQATIAEQMARVDALDTFVDAHAPFQRMVVHLTCGVRERSYLCTLLAAPLSRVLADGALELDADPLAMARAAGHAPVDEVAALDDDATRAEFLRRLQLLRAACESCIEALCSAAHGMPFGMRYVARELCAALQARFPGSGAGAVLRVVAAVLYMRYIHPAIVAPESFGLAPSVLEPRVRRNLAAVSRVLAQVARGAPFGDECVALQPLNEYVLDAGARLHRCIASLVETCPAAELYFGLDEYAEASGTQRPVIYISPNEVYAVHQLLQTNAGSLCGDGDPLAQLLAQLGAPPVSATPELVEARSAEVTLELSHRHAHVSDPDADARALFAETKQLVLALLRVQRDTDTLVELLLAPVTDADEAAWGRTEPTFAEIKARTLENMLQLEQLGRVSRDDGFQQMLNAIALDIKSKHRRRLVRRSERERVLHTLRRLGEQRQFIDAQLASYHECMDRSMQAMQKRAKRRIALPFTQQFFHQRSLKAAGAMPRFGSYKYTAARLRSKGILVRVDGPESLGLDQVSMTISSDEVGVFLIEAAVSGIVAGTSVVRMEELLEAQYRGQACVGVLDDTIHLSVPALIQLINKSTSTPDKLTRRILCVNRYPEPIVVSAVYVAAPAPPHTRCTVHSYFSISPRIDCCSVRRTCACCTPSSSFLSTAHVRCSKKYVPVLHASTLIMGGNTSRYSSACRDLGAAPARGAGRSEYARANTRTAPRLAQRDHIVVEV